VETQTQEGKIEVKKPNIQIHHISYDPDVSVYIFKGEHWILTQLQRRTRISKGFIKALKTWIVLNEERGVEIERTEVQDQTKKKGSNIRLGKHSN